MQVSPEQELTKRLRWLLVFRAAAATAVLLLTLASDLRQGPTSMLSNMMYGVAVATYVVVIVLGLLLRGQAAPVVVIAAAHLATAVMAALAIVQASGGPDSPFSFLYLLAILDGAILGQRRVALAVASAASVAYGSQLAFQLYGVLPTNWVGGRSIPESAYIIAATSHIAAFYLSALLAGQLAELLRRADEAASSARTSLRQARELHKAVLEALPVGVLTVGPSRQIETANAAAARILGSSVAKLQGRSMPQELETFLGSAQAAGEALVTVDGQPRHLSFARSFLVWREDDALDDVIEIIVIEDRTELHELEQTSRRNERLASVGALAAGVAHEIRNPLGAISGAIQMWRGEQTQSTQARLQSIVLREIDRLNALVRDFLLYARPDRLERRPVDLALLLREWVEVARAEQRWADRSFLLSAPESVVADVDSAQVRQVLWNLLRNAAEASPQGAPVELCLALHGEQVSIEVHDRGAGVPAELLGRLFEPFQTTKAGGTGLGLAVVHRIVTAHGGDVRLVPRPGGGTSALVELPVRGA